MKKIVTALYMDMKQRLVCALLLLISSNLVQSQKLSPYTNYNGGRELMGYKDQNGNIVVPAKYATAKYFNGGLAEVAILDENVKWKYGFINEAGKEIIPLIYSSIGSSFSEDLLAVEFKGKWGFINKEGKVVIPYKYEQASFYGCNEGLMGVKLNGKYGFIDKAGNQKVPFIYDECTMFSNGLAGVKFKDKWGYVDNTGKVVISITYDNVSNFSGGLAGAEYNDKWAVINKSGKVLTSFKYDDIGFNYAGKNVELIKVSTYTPGEHKYGVVDKSGREIIPPAYYSLEICSNDLIVVQPVKGKSGLVNSRNKVVLPATYLGIYIDFTHTPPGYLFETPNEKRVFSVEGDKVNIWKYDDVKDEYEDRRAVKYKNKWGFIDEKGTEIISTTFDTVAQFVGNYAMVARNGKVGFIDKGGKEVVAVKYDYIGQASEGLIPVVINNKWGFIDDKGKEVIPLKYDQADYFFDGLAAVILNKKIGFIDKTGKEVIAFQFDELVEEFYKGKAAVKKNGKKIYIDKTGKEIPN